MKRYAKIFVSCLLTFTMVFTSVQWSAIVHETTVVGAAETVPKRRKKLLKKRTRKRFDHFPDGRWKETDGLLRTGCPV